MKRWLGKAALASTLLVVPAAAWGEDDKLADRVSRLERDVAELRVLLKQLLALDRERARILEQAIGGEGAAEHVPDVSHAQHEDRAVEKKASIYGTVTGKVVLPEGETAAYVYVEDVGGRAVKGRRVEIKQADGQFSPRWAVVQKGTTIEFPNEDGIYHNVFAKSPIATFDLGIYRKGDEPKGYVFTKPGDVDVYCNMHAKMSARVLIVPNHLYVRVKPDGTFTLPGVPQGSRKVVAWAPSAQASVQAISVRAGETAEVSFVLEKRAQGQHKNKHGKPYGSYN